MQQRMGRIYHCLLAALGTPRHIRAYSCISFFRSDGEEQKSNEARASRKMPVHPRTANCICMM
jgi:hypothetical protein